MLHHVMLQHSGTQAPKMPDFATDAQMEKLRATYDELVGDALGPMRVVALPVAHTPEDAGAHVAVMHPNSQINGALFPAKMLARASLNQIPYDHKLSDDTIERKIVPAIKQHMHALEFNAVRAHGETGGPQLDPRTSQMKQNWKTRFPPGSEIRFAHAELQAHRDDGSAWTRPGYAFYLKTALPAHIDAAIREAGQNAGSIGELAKSSLVCEARDYATRNHRRVLHEIGNVLGKELGVDHAIFVAENDAKAEIGPHDFFPKMAQPTGPSMSLNEIDPIGEIGVALRHNAASNVRGQGVVLTGDYHQPMWLVASPVNVSRHSKSAINTTHHTNDNTFNTFPATVRPTTQREAQSAWKAITEHRMLHEKVTDSVLPIFTPTPHDVAVHARAAEIATPAYRPTNASSSRHTCFQQLDQAGRDMLKLGVLGHSFGRGTEVIQLHPITSVVNFGVRSSN